MTSDLPLSREPVRLLVVGDLVEENDLPTFLRIFAEVGRWLPSARAILLGDGPCRAALEDQIAELDLLDKVGMPGPVPAARLVELTQRAHIVVCHGTARSGGGLPPALPLAMASGVCIIGTRGGVSDGLIEDGVNGLLVDPHDEAGLSRALHLVITNGDFRRSLGEAVADRTCGRISA